MAGSDAMPAALLLYDFASHARSIYTEAQTFWVVQVGDLMQEVHSRNSLQSLQTLIRLSKREKIINEQKHDFFFLHEVSLKIFFS